MRIISGKYKGRTIKMPEGIRPTQNKVRKALFDILGEINGLSFLELFAGSGAIGFEALSRGAADLTLVEYNRDCLLTIKKNIDSLATKACSLYPQEVEKAIHSLHRNKRKFDIIFLDPPYYGDLSKKTLQTLGAYDILAPNGFMVVQHFKKDNLPDRLGDLPRTTESRPAKAGVVWGLVLFKQARYGDTILSFYKKIQVSV